MALLGPSGLSSPIAGMLGGAGWHLAVRCSAALSAAAATGPPAAAGRGWHQQQQRAPLSSAAEPAPAAPPATSKEACVRPLRLADLIDMHAGGPYGSPAQQKSPLQVLEPGLRNFGGVPAFYGRVSTIRCQESNLLVHEVVKEAGEGRVLVIDNGASTKAAVLGDILTDLARKHGWAGLVVNGCIRDAATVRDIPIGLKALATNPQKPGKGAPGVRDVPVVVGGCVITPGSWLYSDEDGVLISPEPLELPDTEQLEQLQRAYGDRS